MTAPLDTAALRERLRWTENLGHGGATAIAWRSDAILSLCDALDAATARAELLECALSELVALDDGDTPELWRFEEVFTRARAALSRREGA